MKKLLQYMFIFALTLIIAESFLSSQSKSTSTVKFFAPRGLYIYVMGSYNRFSPSEDHFLALGSKRSHAYAPLLGIGYRVVNIKDRVFISLEGEYSAAAYNFGDLASNQKISLLSFMLNTEGRISSQFPLVVFGGFGVGFHGLSDLGYENVKDSITILALDVGIKIPISRHLVIRTEFQWNSESYEHYDYYDEYWDDPGSYGKLDFLSSSSLSGGLEIHF